MNTADSTVKQLVRGENIVLNVGTVDVSVRWPVVGHRIAELINVKHPSSNVTPEDVRHAIQNAWLK